MVELHDCFTANEMLTYEALGLMPEGEAEKFIWTATTPTAARWSPIPRAGCCPRAIRSAPPAWRSAPSWSWQLRGRPTSARSRARRLALQHNLGLGGACVVTLYRRD